MALLVLEAVTIRSKSLNSTKAASKHVKGLIRLYIDTRAENAAIFTVECPLLLLRDYIESLSERGRTVQGAVRHFTNLWSEALGIGGPLQNPLVLSEAAPSTNEAPEHAPSMPLSAVKLIGQGALNIEVTPHRRAFSSMYYECPMSSSVSRMSDDSVRWRRMRIRCAARF